MSRKSRTGGERKRAEAGRSAAVAPALDAQYTELIETVWCCERVWKLEDRIGGGREASNEAVIALIGLKETNKW